MTREEADRLRDEISDREFQEVGDLDLSPPDEIALQHTLSRLLASVIASENADLNMAAARAELPYGKLVAMILSSLENADLDEIIHTLSYFGYDIDISINLDLEVGNPARVEARIAHPEQE